VRVWWLVAAVVAASGACKSTPAPVDAPVACPPAPVDPPCPDAAPTFYDVYQNVFLPTCVVRCHEPGGLDSGHPLMSYQQIYGTDGSTAKAIYNQVFQSCLMPPPNQPEVLTDQQRQKLLDWFGCGAPD
jgi:hypothetical protein